VISESRDAVAIPHLGPRPPVVVVWSSRGRMALVWALLGVLSCADPFSADTPLPPLSASSTAVRLIARLTGYRRDSLGEDRYRVVVLAVDAAGAPVPGAELTYSTLLGSDSVAAPATFDPGGTATMLWVTRDTLSPLHLLEIRSGNRAVLRITGRQEDGLDGIDTLGSGGVHVDTVMSWVPGGITVRVLAPGGRPASDQSLIARVVLGGGEVAQRQVRTDWSGTARIEWRFGASAGPQSLELVVPALGDYEVIDLGPGGKSSGGTALRLEGIALPGAPQRLALGADTLVADAIGARVRVAALGHDAYGNTIAQPSLSLTSSDTNIAKPDPDGTLRVAGTGATRVYVAAGPAKDSLALLVSQKAVAITMSASASSIDRINGRAVVTAQAIDRLGARVADAIVDLRSATPLTAVLKAPDTVIALQAGVAQIEALLPDLADTLVIPIVPIPKAITVLRAFDTLQLDSIRAMPLQVFDSGGTLIPNPVLEPSFSDTTIVRLEPTSSLRALLPGETSVAVRAGPASATYTVTVEGVALLADGIRTTATAAVAAARQLELTNGRVRLRWLPTMGERAAYEVDTRMGPTWVPANVRGAGDWTYVTSTVVTEPTSISLIEAGPGRIGIAMRFGDHWFLPAAHGFPSYYQSEPFPFTRSVWLSPGEYGYFSWTELERTMQWAGTELEVGYGGLWGPATIATGHERLRTDTLTATALLNATAVPEAALFDWDGDPLLRVLVPLPEAPMISPVFPGWGYGSVYLHRMDYQSYGAYLYAAPRTVPLSPRQLCAHAWQDAPFPLRALTSTELAGCGSS
jgi:hypothetical protein